MIEVELHVEIPDADWPALRERFERGEFLGIQAWEQTRVISEEKAAVYKLTACYATLGDLVREISHPDLHRLVGESVDNLVAAVASGDPDLAAVMAGYGNITSGGTRSH
jgi:hypothetical protein